MSQNIMNKPEEMDEFFNIRADGYDQHMRENINSFKDFYCKVSEPINKTIERIEILDLGCGTGLELKGIFEKAPNAFVTGIDLSLEMLQKLRDKYSQFTSQITLINDSYTSYPFDNKKYDYIISVMTMHHLLKEEKLELYKKIRRSLKDGGMYIEGDFVVSDVEEKVLLYEYDKKMKLLEKNGFYHIDVPMSDKSQLKLFKEAGFSDIKIIFKGEYNTVFVVKA